MQNVLLTLLHLTVTTAKLCGHVASEATGLFLAGTTVSLSAHHAFTAECDANEPVTLKGTVTQVEWTNPTSGSTWT